MLDSTLNAPFQTFKRVVLYSVVTEDKALCELFFYLMDKLNNITFNQSVWIIINVLMDSAVEYFYTTEQELEEFTAGFI